MKKIVKLRQISYDKQNIIKERHFDILVTNFNLSGVLPRAWLISICICLPKKTNARESNYNNFRLLLNHYYEERENECINEHLSEEI